jgi:hypothetical protein
VCKRERKIRSKRERCTSHNKPSERKSHTTNSRRQTPERGINMRIGLLDEPQKIMIIIIQRQVQHRPSRSLPFAWPCGRHQRARRRLISPCCSSSYLHSSAASAQVHLESPASSYCCSSAAFLLSSHTVPLSRSELSLCTIVPVSCLPLSIPSMSETVFQSYRHGGTASTTRITQK